ncbi:MAG: hypothetical protein CMJ75_00905 [Planctomycetaceae bacterium]|nr:hypothetical protein [Planctomycetaceae bacterium]
MSADFAGQHVLVTGGGSGLGHAVSLAFAAAGAHVAVVDLNEETALQTVASIRSHHGSAEAYACDVSVGKQVEQTLDAVVARAGPPDVLFNNAGVNRRMPLQDWTEEDWSHVVGVNFIGSFLVARAVGQRMAQRQRGSIVNMSAGGGGLIGLGRGTAVYCGTKGAVVAMTRDLAAEWAADNVRVNCVAPGWIKTGMNAAILRHPVASQRVQQRVPLGRWGEPEDVVGPVLFLASDEARYITGHTLPIDGGVHNIVRLTDDATIQ